MAKRLAAFDFDHTIINDNSDTVLRGLLPETSIPRCKEKSWTKYMQLIFDLLYSHNIHENTIKNTIKKLKSVVNMKELLQELAQNLNFDIIIISDANLYIINTWLDEYKLDGNITKIFSNPAKFVNGVLKLEFYHPFKHSCNLSEPSLCKGDVLEQFIQSQKESGITYSQVVYIGDGVNDLCPMLRLSDGDIAFYRKSFSCEKAISNIMDGKPVRDKIYNLKANVVCWTTGSDILNVLRENKDL